jgi:hypothetical protein
LGLIEGIPKVFATGCADVGWAKTGGVAGAEVAGRVRA